MSQVYKRCVIYDEAIQERTPFDVYAYTRAMNLEQLVEKHTMKIDAFARALITQGNPLFYFPITFPLQADGVRPDEMMQREVDSTMQYHIKRTGVHCIFIPEGSPEERADFILKELSSAEL